MKRKLKYRSIGYKLGVLGGIDYSIDAVHFFDFIFIVLSVVFGMIFFNEPFSIKYFLPFIFVAGLTIFLIGMQIIIVYYSALYYEMYILIDELKINYPDDRICVVCTCIDEIEVLSSKYDLKSGNQCFYAYLRENPMKSLGYDVEITFMLDGCRYKEIINLDKFLENFKLYRETTSKKVPNI